MTPDVIPWCSQRLCNPFTSTPLVHFRTAESYCFHVQHIVVTFDESYKSDLSTQRCIVVCSAWLCVRLDWRELGLEGSVHEECSAGIDSLFVTPSQPWRLYQCWDWEFVCDLVEKRWAFEGSIQNAVLGLNRFVCDLVEESWLLKAAFRMQCWDWNGLCVTWWRMHQ